QELALRHGPMHPRPHSFGRVRQRLKVDMRGEVDQPWSPQRLSELMPADRLQGIADGALDVAVIDDQRGAAVAHDSPGDLERDRVRAPLEDFADLGGAQRPRQKLVEQRDRIAMNTEMKLVVLVDLDDTLMPAIGAHDDLMDRQRVEELVS